MSATQRDYTRSARTVRISLPKDDIDSIGVSDCKHSNHYNLLKLNLRCSKWYGDITIIYYHIIYCHFIHIYVFINFYHLIHQIGKIYLLLFCEVLNVKQSY